MSGKHCRLGQRQQEKDCDGVLCQRQSMNVHIRCSHALAQFESADEEPPPLSFDRAAIQRYPCRVELHVLAKNDSQTLGTEKVTQLLRNDR